MPRRTIRFWLNCLVLTCIIPAVLVTTFTVIKDFRQRKTTFERDLIGTTRALAQAVDAELLSAQSALRILAMSPYLRSGDLALFHREAREVVKIAGGDNIILADPLGQQLLNTREPFGAPLPMRGNLEQHKKVIETGMPVISNVFFGRMTRRPLVSVEVPVSLAGKPRYGLAMGISPESLGRILLKQEMPAGWVASIVDSSGIIVARTLGGSEIVGKEVTPQFRAAFFAAREGAFEGVSREGIDLLTSYTRSATSQWLIAIGVPKEGLIAFLRQTIYDNALAAYVLLVCGILLAGRISARIATSILALRKPAENVGLPGPLNVPPVDIQEAHELGQHFITANRLLEQRIAEANQLRRRMMKIQEEERLRLSRDLHDETGQSLSAAILDLKSIEPFVDECAHDRIEKLRNQLDKTTQMLHRIAWELRPASIDQLGLSHAIESYLAEWSGKHGVSTDFHCADSKLDSRPDDIRTTVYRVVQEALTNVAKHAAGVTRVSVGISVLNGTLHLTIEDNGRGFDTSAPTSRLGLAGLRERLLLVEGQLEIESSLNRGTTVFARMPLQLRRDAA